MKNSNIHYFKTKQAILPLFISDYLNICDPVLVFDRFMEEIDLEKYLRNVPAHVTGRIRYNPISMLKTVGFASPLNDYSAGKTSIDLTWRQSDVKTTDSEDEVSFGKKSNLDWGVTTGLGNNFAIQYNGYNAKSKDAISWSNVDETGIAHVDLKTQELNVLYKLNNNLSVYTGLVRFKASENANISYNDGSPSEFESNTTKAKNKIQFGVIGSTKLAEKTTAYAQVGVASNFTNWKVGVSQEIAPNVEFNVDYRRLKAKKLDFGIGDGEFDVSAKGIGFGITCKF